MLTMANFTVVMSWKIKSAPDNKYKVLIKMFHSVCLQHSAEIQPGLLLLNTFSLLGKSTVIYHYWLSSAEDYT